MVYFGFNIGYADWLHSTFPI